MKRMLHNDNILELFAAGGALVGAVVREEVDVSGSKRCPTNVQLVNPFHLPDKI